MRKYKRTTVKIPTITPSPTYLKLKRENDKIIRQVERIDNGPFGIKKRIRDWLCIDR